MMRQSYQKVRHCYQNHLTEKNDSEDCPKSQISNYNKKENVEEIIRAIQTLSAKFGNGLKHVILSYLDSQTVSFSNHSADEKSESNIKFELYRIENIALEQREMINQQRGELDALKNQISNLKKDSKEKLEQTQMTYKRKIDDYKNIINRLSYYLHDKDLIVKTFSLMKQRTHQTKLQKIKEQKDRLNLKLKQTELANESLVSKEIETEKDIAYILNSQIDGFRNKTFSFLLEKSIVKSIECVGHKTLVDKAVDTEKETKRKISALLYPSLKPRHLEKEPLVTSFQNRKLSRSKKNISLKHRTRSCQTFSSEDVLSVSRMYPIRRLCK